MNTPDTFRFHNARVFAGSMSDLVQCLRDRLDEPADRPTTFIATPNPEMYVNSVFDRDFRSILQSTSFNMVDGMGLHAMLKLFGYRSSRLTGTGLVEELLAQNVGSMYLLGGVPGNMDVMRRKYPQVNFVGGFEGIINEDNAAELAREIDALAPDFLLVALGAPKQERWIRANVERIPNVKVAIGIGGALDYCSGNVRRAPKRVQGLGLEWLFRLALQPERYRRIVKAVAVFPVMFLSIEGSLLVVRNLRRP
ncbi:MAG: WecB/TagA/CpsF family glycosyltransferase [Myxococcota bacterium]|nr:WecB/TagA/CpsF family glycosyltransferase [Myxococcota bacterium]